MRAEIVGISLGPVPIEETFFYLLTALMVSQGFVLVWGAWEDRASLGWPLRRLSGVRACPISESAGTDAWLPEATSEEGCQSLRSTER